MMRRVCLGLIIFFFSTLVMAQSMTGVSLDTLNLRSGAGKNYAVITQIPINTTLTLNGRNANSTWLWVDYNGQVGWVSARYVQLNGITLADLPISTQTTTVTPSSPSTATPPTTATTNLQGFTRIRVGSSNIPITDPDVNLTNWSLSITLHWNSTANLDIAVQEPSGFVLKPSSGTSPSGGALNIPSGVNNDCNDRDSAALEVANWALEDAPKGTYTITVTYSNQCFVDQEEKTLFWVSVKDEGPQKEFWVYYIEPNTIYEFTYTKK